MMSLLWAGLLGVLDGVERRADVAVFGLEEAGQPPAFVAEAHGQHGRQRLHQTGVGFWRGRGRGLMRGVVTDAQRHTETTLTLRQVWVEGRLPQACGPLRGGVWLRGPLAPRLQRLELTCRRVHFFGAQVSPLLVRVAAHLQNQVFWLVTGPSLIGWKVFECY